MKPDDHWETSYSKEKECSWQEWYLRFCLSFTCENLAWMGWAYKIKCNSGGVYKRAFILISVVVLVAQGNEKGYGLY